jgi:hypothetical protein
MSLSLPGASGSPGLSPGLSMARRSPLRAARSRRAAATEPPVAAGGPDTRRLPELAEALRRIQAATGLDGRQVATRLVEPLDPAAPLRALDVFAAGRADLVTAYLQGRLDGPGLLTAWQCG